jgi:hypothetical protein
MGVAICLVAAVIVAAVVARSTSPTAAAGSTRPVARLARSAAEARWLDVLERLDTLREHAWLTDDPGALRRVYAPGSAALRADLRMLAAYRSRGLRPDRVRMAFSELRVVGVRRLEVTLAVVDELQPVRVSTDVGARVALPADQPTAHTIMLRRVDGRWLIADVRAEPVS